MPAAFETPVLHIDIDAFFASIEKLRNPRLSQQPVAVGTGVIASCCYVARQFGLYAGMPLGEARRRCRSLIILEGHYAIYRCFAEEVFSRCQEIAPSVESYLDEAFCDLNGTQRLTDWSEARLKKFQARVKKEVGLDISLGLGPNRMVAQMASKSAKPAGARLVLPEQIETFIKDLPIRSLPGVGSKTEKLLKKLNIKTIGSLRLLDRTSLKAMLGQVGEVLYERCRGRDTRIISTREIPRSISRETSFHQETTDAHEIEGMIHYLSERAGNTMRKLGLSCRKIGVKIRTADFRGEQTATRLKAPTNIDAEIFVEALTRYRRLHKRRVALRLVGITLLDLVPESSTIALDLFEPSPEEVLANLKADSNSRSQPSLHGEHLGEEHREEEAEEAWQAPEVENLLEHASQVARSKARASQLCTSLDEIRERYGHSSVLSGQSIGLLGQLPQDVNGFILRTPCLTR